MDEALQNHGFGDIDESQMQSGAPVGVDEAEMMLSSMPSPTSTAATDGSGESSSPSSIRNEALGFPSRPGLQRESSVPQPHQPPPPAPPQPIHKSESEDSLSLMQLKNLVRDLPRVEPTPYAFVYRDTAVLPDELEEWFTYAVEEQAMILKSRSTFAEEWSEFNDDANAASYLAGGLDWTDQQRAGKRHQFIQSLLDGLDSVSLTERTKRLEALLYIAMGCWHETAGIQRYDDEEAQSYSSGAESLHDWISAHRYSVLQLRQIEANAGEIVSGHGFSWIFSILRSVCDRETAPPTTADEEKGLSVRDSEKSELWCTLTIFYFLLEVIRSTSNEELRALGREQLLQLEPNVLVYLSSVLDKVRWDDTIELPLTKVLLFYWKAVLVMFGGSAELTVVKETFIDQDEETSDSKGFPIITASPLDYHLFRQEISSKYPAYNPPAPLFPLEPENSSMMPPLKRTLQKLSDTAPGLASLQGHGNSILNQPVHIATPAPSPPPSPAVGGKGGKKQNYQTNNLFPFLYPPLDETSNRLGGRGSTDLQDALVGRKWEGSDIPASILEAAELFAKRMRATRAMKQLWEQRVEFMKYERGWKNPEEDADVESVIALDLGSDNKKEEDEDEEETPRRRDGNVDDRLDAVEEFYVSFCC